MPHCPICRDETDEVVRSQELEVRGKKYLRQMCYCPNCAVKFTFFSQVESEPPVEES